MLKSDQEGASTAETSRPWFKFYDQGLRPHLDYPRVPLWQLLDASAARYPDKLCIYFFGKETTYAQIREATDRFAAGLVRLGVRPGDRVALLLPNCPQFVIAFYGLLKAGAVGALLSPLLTETELKESLSQARAETLITIPMFLAKVRAIASQTALRRIIRTGLAAALPLPTSLVMSLSEMREIAVSRRAAPSASFRQSAPAEVDMEELLHSPAPAGFKSVESQPDDTAVLLFSGGTTGTSKVIALSHFNLVANAYQVASWGHLLEHGPDEHGRMLCVLPLFHGYGLSVTMNAPVAAGFEMVLVPRFKARELLKTIQKTKPRFMVGVPTLFAALSNVPDVERFDLQGIEGIFVGAAPLTRALKEQFETRTGARMLEGYGLTESVTAIMANPLRGMHKVGSAGIPFPDTDVKIVSLEDGSDLPPGESGEIMLAGPTVMKGYEGDPEATASAIVAGGWLKTGDIGYMDQDGYFYITDRKKELIKVSGFNVFPREIDEAIAAHPKVKEAACLGLPDPYRGERIKVFIVLKPGENATAEEFIAFFRERLAGYKVPSEVEFRSELPKNAIGKVVRRQLREQEAR